MKLVLLLISLVLLPLTPALAFDVGPAIGARVPNFELRDSEGDRQSIATLTAKKGVVLVFFRSAKWCPFCKAQLISLKDAVAPLMERGYRLIGISYDPVPILADFIKERSLNFTLLSDEGSKTIDAFGIRDPQYKEGSVAFGVPQPSIFIVSTDGIIQAKLAEEGYKVRPSLDAMFAAIDAVGKGK